MQSTPEPKLPDWQESARRRNALALAELRLCEKCTGTCLKECRDYFKPCKDENGEWTAKPCPYSRLDEDRKAYYEAKEIPPLMTEAERAEFRNKLEGYRREYREKYLPKVRAELEAKYGMLFDDEQFREVLHAEAEMKCLCDFDSDLVKKCGKDRGCYEKPTVKIIDGEVVIGRERCAVWKEIVYPRRCLTAGIPKKYLGKTFEDYEITEDNAEAIGLAKGYCIHKPQCGLYFHGGAGTGKTFLSSIVAQKYIWDYKRVVIGDVPSLLDEIKATFDGQGSAQKIINRYMNCDLLILDDIGAGWLKGWGVGQLYQIINARYNDDKPLIVTSNYDLRGLQERMRSDDEGMTGRRIISRLAEMCEVAYFGTRDRRRRKW